ncbi:MAG: amidohydrolase [Dehalococcoidia bacterium]|nr:amidohydrolase [Dehalococcoidia bacterium]
MSYPVFSSDGHVLEPPDVWTGRILRQFADRAPRLVMGEPADWWHAEGKRVVSCAAGAMAGIKHRDEQAWRHRPYEAKFSAVRRGAYQPAARVADMDTDGIAGEVMYPTVGLALYRLEDPALTNAVFSAYNSWLAEFCAAAPRRIKGVAMLNLDDVAIGVAELRRTAQAGLAGAMITVNPGESRGYDQAIYEPLWAAAAEAGIPLSLHLATDRPAGAPKSAEPMVSALSDTPAKLVTRVVWAQDSLARMIYAGVFQRHPKLTVVIVEHDLAWAAPFLQTIDNDYCHRPWRPGWPRFQGGAIPSDFFKRNVVISFQDDALGVRLRDVIGTDSISWGSDYPHPDSTFPQSKRILGDILLGVPEADAAKIAGGVTARIYGF